MDSLIDYVRDHTSCSPVGWRVSEPSRWGPFPVSIVQTAETEPRKDKFLELVRADPAMVSSINLLDGEEHGLAELERWLPGKRLPLKFVGLGAYLGVFELVRSWEKDVREGETVEELTRRLVKSNHVRFKFLHEDSGG